LFCETDKGIEVVTPSVMEEEKECRVCREGDDDGENPLYAPCLCSGSILYCHEECLVEWLKRSGKDYCELCKTTYVFQPKYAPNTPEILPKNELITGVTRLVLTKFVLKVFRVTLALVAWLVIMPCITSTLYRSLVFTYKPTHPFAFSNSGSVAGDAFTVEKYSNYLYHNVVSGLLLTGIIIVTFIIMMSFGDFLRSYWNLTNNPQQQANPEQQAHQQQDNLNQQANAPMWDNRQPHRAANPPRRQPPPVVARPNAAERLRVRPAAHVEDQRIRNVGALLQPQDGRVPMVQHANGNSRQMPEGSDGGDDREVITSSYNTSKLTSAGALDEKEDVSKVDGELGSQSARSVQHHTLPANSLKQAGEYPYLETDFEENLTIREGIKEDIKVESLQHVNAVVDNEEIWISSSDSDDSSWESDHDEEPMGNNHNIGLEGVGVMNDVVDVVEEEEAGPIDGFLEALGLNNLQMELEMEMEMDGVGAGGLLIDDEVQEEERLRFLQAEEHRQEQARLRHEDEMDLRREHEIRHAEERPQDIPQFDLPQDEVQPPAPPDNAGMGAEGRAVPGGAAGGADGLELRLNIGELMGVAGPISSMLRCVAWMLLFNAACIFIGYSIPSFFGYLTTVRNPIKAVIQIMTLGQADTIIRIGTAGQWHSLSGLWDGITDHFFPTTTTVALDTHTNRWLLELMTGVRTYCEEFLARASNTQNLVNIPDLLVIMAGYLLLIVDSFVLSQLSSLLSHRLTRGGTLRLGRNSKALFQFVNVVVDIVKIGVLLGVRIFLLPCVVGFVIYACWNVFLFGYESEMLLNFCINNIVGSISVLWGMGISFMLYSTIAILQLREILHPSFLARFIRPQESQSDLLTSLLQDKTPTQIKRLVVSFFVYTLLIGAFVFFPLFIIHTIGGAIVDKYAPLGTYWNSERIGALVLSVIEMRTHYFAPEVQIPLEVGLLHTTFLMFLEKFKDFIGTFEFYSLVYLSEKLHLNRFLLPYTYKILAPLSDDVQCFEDLPLSIQHLHKDKEVLVVDGSLVVVCARPMMRPPAGWDARVRESTTRWAWSDEARFPLEKSVLPNVYPGNAFKTGHVINSTDDDAGASNTPVVKASLLSSLWHWVTTFSKHPSFGLRLLVLVMICWLLAVLGSLVPALLPFVLGRAIFFALRLPNVLCHDPFAYFVGNFFMQRVIKGFEELQDSLYGRLATLVWNWQWQRYIPRTDDEDSAVAMSRCEPSGGEKKATWWNLAGETLRTFFIGWLFLPLCIGLAYNAFLLFRPLSFIAALQDFLGASVAATASTPTEVSVAFEPVVPDFISLLVHMMLYREEPVSMYLLLKELTRTVLLGQFLTFVFVVLVLSRQLKTILAVVGVSVLRSDVEGEPSIEEIQQEAAAKSLRSRHWLMRWHLLFFEDDSFVNLVKNLEWQIDCFAATFVRSSPSTIMQDHLATPRPVRTFVTTLQADLVVHHTTTMLRAYNNAFIFTTHACWFMQFVLGSYMLAISAIFLKTVLVMPHSCASPGAMNSFSLELHVLLPLLVMYSLWIWLDSAVAAGTHLRRGWNAFVLDIHKAIKDDYYLIGKELQNSAEGLKHMASIQDSVASTAD